MAALLHPYGGNQRKAYRAVQPPSIDMHAP